MSVNITPLVALARIGEMIPGQRESGSLTRFASSPQMPDSMVDVTLNAATIADRQREGGVPHGSDAPLVYLAGRRSSSAFVQCGVFAEHRRRWGLLDSGAVVGLIRFRGHLSYGGYDVQTDGRDTEAPAAPAI